MKIKKNSLKMLLLLIIAMLLLNIRKGQPPFSIKLYKFGLNIKL